VNTPTTPTVVYTSDVPPHVAIRRRREDLHLTQSDLARIALDDYGIEGNPGSGKPIAIGLLSEIEKGVKWPPPSRPLAAILLVLGFEFEDLGLDPSYDKFAQAAVRGFRQKPTDPDGEQQPRSDAAAIRTWRRKGVRAPSRVLTASSTAHQAA
jgi:transcriptional regulator with XRE-family HTH domain